MRGDGFGEGCGVLLLRRDSFAAFGIALEASKSNLSATEISAKAAMGGGEPATGASAGCCGDAAGCELGFAKVEETFTQKSVTAAIPTAKCCDDRTLSACRPARVHHDLDARL